ncbi:MAG: response regulator transcription factor [Bacteroidetes bacterium]|nr:response regulator transcription factor [Bacteroidota bacterium]
MTQIIKAIIVDDEIACQKTLSLLLQNLQSNIQIIACCDNADDAFICIQKLKPDLVFLDIKMPGKDGMQLLEMFQNPDFSVVFVTGYDQFALKAFELNAIDYILKPIDVERFDLSVQKITRNVQQQKELRFLYSNLNNSIDFQKKTVAKLLFHYADQVVILNVQDIVCFNSQDGVLDIYSTGFKTIRSTKNLMDYEEILKNYPHFIRINKSCLINALHILSYSKGDPCEITLYGGLTHEVSRRRKTEILKTLQYLLKP